LLFPELILQIAWHCVLLQMLQRFVPAPTAQLKASDVITEWHVGNRGHLQGILFAPKFPISFS
jgi:hypothetical protein